MKKVWVKREDAYSKPSIFRQKKKLVLIIFLVIAVLFFFYQFLFISLLTKSESDLGKKEQAKIVMDHVSKSPHVKSAVDIGSVFDDKGLVKGTRLMDLINYKPNSDGKFTCFISKLEIDFSLVNDNYCDCPEDGSDEPGTNACEKGHFYCKYQQRHRTGRGHPQRIQSSRVNDGICDCCDGSDEWRKLQLVHHIPLELQKKLGRYQVPCPYVCLNS